MALRRYQITGRGSLTRWEDDKGVPYPAGSQPPPNAQLAFHSAKERSELILEETEAARADYARFKLVPILDRDSITVKTDATPKKPARASSEASVSSNIG